MDTTMLINPAMLAEMAAMRAQGMQLSATHECAWDDEGDEDQVSFKPRRRRRRGRAADRSRWVAGGAGGARRLWRLEGGALQGRAGGAAGRADRGDGAFDDG